MQSHLSPSIAAGQSPSHLKTPGKRTLVVEFVGLPGCGKTTAADQVLPLLGAKGIRCRGRRSVHQPWNKRLRTYASTAAFHLRHPGSVAASLARALSLSPLELRRLPQALRMAGWSRHLKQPMIGNYDLLVFDQGIVQDAWSLALGASREHETQLRRSIQASVGDVAVNLAYVYFDIDIDLAVERIRARANGTSRFDRMADDKARQMLHEHRADLERCFTFAVEATGARSCHIDASSTLDKTTQQVLEFILDVLAWEERGATARPHRTPRQQDPA